MKPKNGLMESFMRMWGDLIIKNKDNGRYQILRKSDPDTGNISVIIAVNCGDSELIIEFRIMFDNIKTGHSQVGYNIIWSHNINKTNFYPTWKAVYEMLYKKIGEQNE